MHYWCSSSLAWSGWVECLKWSLQVFYNKARPHFGPEYVSSGIPGITGPSGNYLPFSLFGFIKYSKLFFLFVMFVFYISDSTSPCLKKMKMLPSNCVSKSWNQSKKICITARPNYGRVSKFLNRRRKILETILGDPKQQSYLFDHMENSSTLPANYQESDNWKQNE